MSGLRGLWLFSSLLLCAIAGNANPLPIPAGAGLVATFRDFSALQAVLGAVRALQGTGGPAPLPADWSSRLLSGAGIDLASADGLRRLGVDPGKRMTVAYMEQLDLLYVALPLAAEGLKTVPFEFLLRKLSGQTGKVIASRFGRVTVYSLARRKAGYGLHYFVHQGTLVVCNTLAGARNSLQVLAGQRAGFSARHDPFFLQADAALYATAEGINRFFRYQIPYDSFFQDYPLEGFFRNCILRYTSATGQFSFRFLPDNRHNSYVRMFRTLFPAAGTGQLREPSGNCPLLLAARFNPETAIRMLLNSLPETWQTAFFIESIKIKNSYGLDILRDLVWNWDGRIRLQLLPQGGRPVPVLALSFYRPLTPALLLEPLRKSGLLKEVTVKDRIHHCTFRDPLPLFGTGGALAFEGNTVYIAPLARALGEVRRFPARTPVQAGVFLCITPGRLLDSWGKRDSRNDLRTFLQTFSRAGLFLMEARHSGPYIYLELRQKPER